MSISIAQLFASIPQRFKAARAENVSGVFHFDIIGPSGGKYTVHIQNKTCTVSPAWIGKADCIVQVNAKTYIAIETGKLSAEWAFISGRLKVSNIPIMLQFLKLFRKFKPEMLTQNPTSIERPALKGPLTGIRILDLSRLLPAPLATMHLADLGAEVIKIEDPNSPDPIRAYPPFIGEHSAYYLAVNRSKKSLTLNIRSTEGKAIFLKLLKKTDIVVESFRPGVLKKIGIDYNIARQYNKRIIYVSVTGYGQTGIQRQKAGHDLNYIAESGLAYLNGTNKEQLAIPAFQIADIGAGSYSTINACLLALWHRERTGLGEHVDVSMYDACLPFLTLPMANYQANSLVPNAASTMLSGQLPNYNIYKCADNKWIALGALEPKFWRNFCIAIGKPDWQNACVPDNKMAQQVIKEMRVLIATKNQEYWLQLGMQYDTCLSAINTLAEVVTHPVTKERNMLTTHTHTQQQTQSTGINQPLKFTHTNLGKGWHPPTLGEDTITVLKSLGISTNAMQALQQKNII